MSNERRERHDCACDGQTLLAVHTKQTCYDPTPADERRERYAAAQYALSVWTDRVPWVELEAYVRAEWYPSADAAMAVADEEIGEAVNERNVSLGGALGRSEDEIASLRAQLREFREANDYLHDCIETLRHDKQLCDEAANEYAATIERVRIVLDSTSWASNFKDRIRDALDGES